METIPPVTRFYLEFDFDILTINDLAEIIKILKHSTSLVNPDIFDIADEVICRFSHGLIFSTPEEALSVKIIYNSLKYIPHSQERMRIIYDYYNALLFPSPSVSPVKTPRTSNTNIPIPFIKKCKKLKDD
jgi:hypothetical protein